MATLRTVLKLLGVAAVAGVAAGGVLVARDERRRAAYSPDEVRARLHARLARAEGGTVGAVGDHVTPTTPEAGPGA